jgi:hypothetical protein
MPQASMPTGIPKSLYPTIFWLASMPYYLKAFKSFLFFGWRIRFMRGIWRLRAITGTF